MFQRKSLSSSSNFGMLETLEDRRLMSAAGVFSTGGALGERVNDMTVDNKGNVYVTGAFQGSTDFQPGSGTKIVKAKGKYGGYTAKYSPSGKLAWVYTWGKKEADSSGQSVAVDKSGNVVVGGRISSGVSDTDQLIMKLDKKGKLLWKNAQANTSYLGLKSVAVDVKGNVYAAGGFSDTLKFGGTTLDVGGAWSGDAYAVKFDKNGKPVWARQFGSPNDSDHAVGVATDAALNVYITGNFSGPTDFDPDPDEEHMVSQTGFGSDAFLLKLNKKGDFRWVGTVAGDSTDSAGDVATDPDGNVYVTGSFEDTANVGDEEITSVNGTKDGFIAKFNDAGKVEFAEGFGGAGSEMGTTLAADATGVYVVGYFNGTADLEPGAGESNFTCVGWSNGFIMKLKNDGRHAFTRQIVQKQQVFTSGSNSIAGIACNPDGEIVVAGTYEWETDFDPSKKKEILESVNWDPDIFVLTLNAKGNL